MTTARTLQAGHYNVILLAMLVQVAWAFFSLELILAVAFGIVFWYFWSRSAIQRSVLIKALIVYALGCILCLLFALVVLL